MKKVLKIIGIVLAVLITPVIILFTYLTIKEYDPAAKESVEISTGKQPLNKNDALSIVTFNIGYASYNADADFFMDGGKMVRVESKDIIDSNLSGISSFLNEEQADIYLLQEVDLDSKRSFNINEQSYLNAATGVSSAFAYNYKVDFVPYPLPPIGKVNSGVAIYTDLEAGEANRYQLYCPFGWPVKIGNLKRCILEERIPIENSDKELVVYNIHLEAYDDGEGKEKQTEQLMQLISDEYSIGNYVVVGGDFNQGFDVVEQPEILYPDDWMPGTIEASALPKGFSFAVADNASTCRSLGRAYESAETSQTYIIDGFIVSDNVNVETLEVVDLGFEYSDHNPVKINIRLK